VTNGCYGALCSSAKISKRFRQQPQIRDIDAIFLTPQRTPQPDFEPEHCAEMSDDGSDSDVPLDWGTGTTASTSTATTTTTTNPPTAPSQPTSAALTAALNDAAAARQALAAERTLNKVLTKDNKALRKENAASKEPAKLKGQFTMQFRAGEVWGGLRPNMKVEINRTADDCVEFRALLLFLEAAGSTKYQECMAPHISGCESQLWTCTRVQLRCLDEPQTFLDAPDDEKWQEWMLNELLKGSRDFFARVDVEITQNREVMEGWMMQDLWVRSLAWVREFGLQGFDDASNYGRDEDMSY
jgi:hypothetical protein